MPETYGFTHATISKSTDPNDPFVFHIHALRAGEGERPDGEKELIARVDDDRPMLATRILRVLRDRGITIEGDPLEINMDEPDISFLTLRGSMDENETEWTDLEVRYDDGQKGASATFPEKYEAFAYGMLVLFGPKDPAYQRFAMFSYQWHGASGGWSDFVESFDTLDGAKANWRWTRASPHHNTEVEIVDLATMTSVESKTIPAANG